LVEIDHEPRKILDLSLRKILRTEIRDFGVNLIHVHQPNLLSAIVPWVWNRSDLVVVASRHIMNAHNKKNPFHSLIYRRLDSLVVMSDALRENVMETHPLKDRQVKVIHYGLDYSRFDPTQFDREAQRREWGASPDTIVIGVVGRLDPAKGQDVFLRAGAGLLMGKSAEERMRFRFVIVGDETRGGEGGYRDHLLALTRELQLEDRVLFTGFTKDVPRVMSALDLFVMPSRQEAFGLVAIEAMAMKTPIVISKGGSADEIAGTAEERGCLVRPLDAFDLQQKLKYLIEHPDVRRRMGDLGCEFVRRYYDREIRLQNTLDLYERLLRRRRL
jgi:glycosyltransferase involved in cell wall biosynthesis